VQYVPFHGAYSAVLEPVMYEFFTIIDKEFYITTAFKDVVEGGRESKG
jgi:hypothetical protein